MVYSKRSRNAKHTIKKKKGSKFENESSKWAKNWDIFISEGYLFFFKGSWMLGTVVFPMDISCSRGKVETR